MSVTRSPISPPRSVSSGARAQRVPCSQSASAPASLPFAICLLRRVECARLLSIGLGLSCLFMYSTTRPISVNRRARQCAVRAYTLLHSVSSLSLSISCQRHNLSPLPRPQYTVYLLVGSGSGLGTRSHGQLALSWFFSCFSHRYFFFAFSTYLHLDVDALLSFHISIFLCLVRTFTTSFPRCTMYYHYLFSPLYHHITSSRIRRQTYTHSNVRCPINTLR